MVFRLVSRHGSAGRAALRRLGPASLARLAWLALLLLGVANASARAQSGPFDPDVELPRFGEMSGWRQAWMLKSLLAKRGKAVTAAERAALQAEWKKLAPAIEARHAAAEKDPYLARIDHTRTSLAREPFFADLRYRVREETRPFALFIEVPGRNDQEDEQRAQRIADSYAPFLSGFLAKLEQEIAPLIEPMPESAAPIGPIPAPPHYIVWVLQDEASYARFFREYGGGESVLGVRAHYSLQQRFAFTWSPSSTSGEAFLDGVQTLLHELTHAWLDAHVHGGLATIRSHWINEGLPEYLSCWKRRDERTVFFDPLWSARVRETLAKVKLATGELRIDHGDWLVAKDGGAVAELAARVSRQRLGGVAPEAVAFLMSRFYADAYLFILWLHQTRDGRYRDRFRDYLKDELNGRGGLEAFKARLGEVLTLPLEAELELYGRELLEKRDPVAREATQLQEAAARTARATPAARQFDHVTALDGLVRAAELPATTQRALRWQRFVEAGLRDGANLFAAADGDRELADALERELAALFAKLKQQGNAALFDEGLKGKVVEFDDAKVVVEAGGARRELPRAELLPGRLAFLLRTNGDKGERGAVAAALLELLGGDMKKARDAGKRAGGALAKPLQALLGEGEALLRELAVAAALGRIVRSAPADLEAAARAQWPKARGSQLANHVAEPLRALLAERLATHLSLEQSLAASCRGTTTAEPPAAGGAADAPRRVALEWKFERPEEAGDFAPQPYPALLRSVLEATDRKVPESRAWRSENGRLRPAPAGYVVVPLPFAAGSEIELELVVAESVDQGAMNGASFQFGLVVDGSEDLLLCDGLQSLIGYDRGRPDLAAVPSEGQLAPGQSIASKLAIGPLQTIATIRGKTARLTFKFDGTARLVLFGSGERCWQVERLLLRAVVPPDAAAALRSEAGKRLAAALLAE
ncbi:MAG: hypothetical protein JNL90_16610 [Planctomycetes bacterium]|nr:hypothetical protein [Planctomycetota bacterium]